MGSKSNRFVLKTDVKAYYASISHQRMLELLAPFIQDQRIHALVYQYLKRSAERGGLFFDYSQGIALGCPLSPVLGTFFLYTLDVALQRTGLFYLRFMDDILVLAPTRPKLRRAVKVVNRQLAALELEKQRPRPSLAGSSGASIFWAIGSARTGLAWRPGRSRIFWNMRFGFTSTSLKSPSAARTVA